MRRCTVPTSWKCSTGEDVEDDMLESDASDDEAQSVGGDSRCASVAGSYASDLEEFSDAEDDNDDGPTPNSSKTSTGKLWTKDIFPEGVKGPANWDLQNLKAAQSWQCPCQDRNFLSIERYPKVDPLYDLRKTFQTTSKGMRDTFRKTYLEPTYNTEAGTFSRSVRIG